MATARCIAAAFAILAATLAQAADVTLTALTGSPHVSDLVEFRIDPARQYTNPFNPDEVAIDAIVTTPKGTQLRIPAFWYQQQTPQSADPGKPPRIQPGESFWMLRLCPTEPGQYTLYTEVKEDSGTRKSDPTRLTVLPAPKPSPARGFVRVAQNQRYFAFDSGDAYFIVGINMSWGTWAMWSDQFDRWFTKLAQNGGNFARIWMTEQRWRLEHPDTGLGRYDLASGAFYDEVLDSARKHGIYVMLTFLNHRDLLEKDMWGPASWPTSPYNAAKGGPATRPVDFFTDPAARRAFKNRLRYTVARYSAYTSLAFWELFNEQEIAGLGPQVQWNQEMSQYLSDIDPYRHLVTTSCQNLPDELWKLPTIACTQVHYYGDGTTIDLVTPTASESRRLQAFAKPQITTEYGISYKSTDKDLDPTGQATTLHNGLWAAMMSGSAGGACHWYWDNYVDPQNLWPLYKPFARFAQEIDWAKRDFRALPGITAQYSTSDPQTFTDAHLPCTIDWQKAHGQTITLLPTGKTDRALPRFLFSTAKPELRAPCILSVDLANPSDMVLHIASVCDFAAIRVSIDGQPTRDFPFSALPGAPDLESTKPWKDGPPYIATINKQRRLPIPAGKHTITLDNIGGDWVKLDSITFTSAISSRYADITVLALQDPATSQTLFWVLDERSNWKNDKEGKTPESHEAVQVTIPVKHPGTYRITWYDTRQGTEILHDTLQTTGPTLQAKSPRFTRDIAASLSRE